MSEELKQRGLLEKGIKVGNFEVYNLGATTLKTLAKFGVIPKKDYGKYATRKPDLLVVDKSNPTKPIVITVVEWKDGGKFVTENDKVEAIQQGNDIAQLVNARIGVATDGEKFIWFNPSHKNSKTEYKDKTTGIKRSYTVITREDGTLFSDLFAMEQITDETDPEKLQDNIRQTYLDLINLGVILDKNNSIISNLKSINPLPLAKSVWQDIWIATGKSPEKCLYNVIEIFIFKFLSDLEVLREPENFEYLLSLTEKGKTDEEILDHYAKICREKIQTLFPASQHDKTTIINGTIFVDEKGNAIPSQAVLFRNSLQKFKDFERLSGKLKNIDKDFKTKLYETFLKETQGLKGLGQYFTPRKVIQSMVRMSGIESLVEGQKVCDPFCGVGGFVLEPLNIFDNLRIDFIPKEGKIKPKIVHLGYDKGFERDDDRTIILAKANMLIYLSDILVKFSHIPEEFAHAFNNTFILSRTNLGSLEIIPTKEEDRFDLILTNPPYVTKGKKTIINEIQSKGRVKSFFKINSIGVEGLALEWIIRNLKKGGSAFVIIPDGLLNRLKDKKMREFILQECYLNAIISLPKKTFFATPKKTYILSITKKQNSTDKQILPAFTYLVKDIGERLDVTRFDIQENDLKEMVSQYNQFKGARDTFQTTSQKCKIQTIEKFQQEPSWIIDRWWTDEEKQTLHIVDGGEVLSLDEFQDKLNDLQISLNEARTELKKIEMDTNTEFIEKELQDIFDLKFKTNNSKFTRSFVDTHKGVIPVYSASKDPDFLGYGRVADNLPNIKYFENCLTWNIDGYIGKAFYRKGRFTLSEKVIPLVLRKDFSKIIDYEYLKYVIEKESIKKDLNFSNKAGKSRISDIKIRLPINNANKEIDLQKQKELAKRYKVVEDIKEQISEEMNAIKEASIEL